MIDDSFDSIFSNVSQFEGKKAKIKPNKID